MTIGVTDIFGVLNILSQYKAILKPVHNNHLENKSDHRHWPGTAGEWAGGGKRGVHILGESGLWERNKVHKLSCHSHCTI